MSHMLRHGNSLSHLRFDLRHGSQFLAGTTTSSASLTYTHRLFSLRHISHGNSPSHVRRFLGHCLRFLASARCFSSAVIGGFRFLPAWLPIGRTGFGGATITTLYRQLSGCPFHTHLSQGCIPLHLYGFATDIIWYVAINTA